MDNHALVNEIETKEDGANKVLRYLASQSGGCFDFFSSQLKTIKIIRKREKKKKKLNGAERAELSRIYFIIFLIVQRGDVPTFREIVPRHEIASWLNHTKLSLQEKINDPYWINTGNLLQHDEYLFSTFCQMLHHILPLTMTFENSADADEANSDGTKILEIITSMMISRKGASNEFPGPSFMYSICCLLFGPFLCATDFLDHRWKPYKLFKTFDAAGILEQYLRCTTLQSVQEATVATKGYVFQKLLRCTKFVRKRLKEGTPCGDTIRAIVSHDGDLSVNCSYTLPFLQTLVKLSTLLQIDDVADDEVNCQHCKKVSSRNNYMHCGRCKRVNYCSRTCQKAHWKEHKEACCVVEDVSPILSRAAIWQILERAYVDIMVRLVEECDKADGLALKDMVLELDFLPNESGRIPMIQEPPLFETIPIARHLDGTRPRELQLAKGSDDVDQSNEFLEQMTMELTEKLSCGSSDSHLLCFELHPTEWLYDFHQLNTEDRGRPMFTEEALDAFRVAMVNDDYTRLSSIFEKDELIESYKHRIRSLQSAGAQKALPASK